MITCDSTIQASSYHTAINVTMELSEPSDIKPAEIGDFHDMVGHGQFTVEEDSKVLDHIRALDE